MTVFFVLHKEKTRQNSKYTKQDHYRTQCHSPVHKSHLLPVQTNTGPSFSTHSTSKFSQFLNFESSLPKIQENICLAFILARTTPRDLYQWAGDDSLPPSAEYCCLFSRICLRIPTSSSLTLWLMPTEISMNLALYVQARHLPSVKRKYAVRFSVY